MNRPAISDERERTTSTIRDVAKASRVSVATVSRVFNNFPRVSAATRRRVVAAAGRLGYWPNGTARSLITNRTHALGVLLPDLHGEFFSELIRGIDSAARQHHLHLLVSSFRSDPDDMTAALRAVRGRVDGLIVMAPDLDPSSPMLAGAWTIPAVFLNPETEPVGINSISLANYEGACAVVSHLVRLGHRQIATVLGPERNIDARQRLEGYRDALRKAGLESSETLEIPGNFSERSGYEAGCVLAEHSPRPTAVFAANDHMAIGVMGAMQDAGLAVPGDVAVAGFDDIPMARYLNPPLTTVHVDVLGLGQRAVELLLHPGRERPGQHETMTTTLVVRSSCGAKPPADEGPGVRWERRHPVTARPRRDPKDDAEG